MKKYGSYAIVPHDMPLKEAAAAIAEAAMIALEELLPDRIYYDFSIHINMNDIENGTMCYTVSWLAKVDEDGDIKQLSSD